MKKWNATKNEAEKIFMLDEQLQKLGMGPIPAYDRICAAAKRQEYIGGMSFAGTITPSKAGAAGSAKAACSG